MILNKEAVQAQQLHILLQCKQIHITYVSFMLLKRNKIFSINRQINRCIVLYDSI